MTDTASQLNVVAVTFEHDTDAYAALTSIKELDSQHQIELQAAAVVVRDDSGKVVVKDSTGDGSLAGTATGGLIGLLIGILGGPLGILIGGTMGLLMGSLFDLEGEEDTESVLGELSRSVRTDHTTLLAEVNEPSPEVIDSAMARLSGTVVRRSASDVEGEIAAAEAAQRAARKEARKHLREQRNAEHKEQVDTKIEQLKAKLHHQQETAAPSQQTAAPSQQTAAPSH